MDPNDPNVMRLREQHAGNYIAWLGNEVFLTAPTYDELCDQLDSMPIDQGKVVVSYVETLDVVRVY